MQDQDRLTLTLKIIIKKKQEKNKIPLQKVFLMAPQTVISYSANISKHPNCIH